MNSIRLEDLERYLKDLDVVGKTERFLAAVWGLRWLIVVFFVIGSGLYFYAGYLSDTNGQPEIKSVSFDHQIAFKYLGADTGKYASNLQLSKDAMSNDGWYGQMVIRSGEDPDLITWKFSLVKGGQIVDLKERKYYPPAYYKLFNYDTGAARYQKGGFRDTDTFSWYFMFAIITLFIVVVYHSRWY